MVQCAFARPSLAMPRAEEHSIDEILMSDIWIQAANGFYFPAFNLGADSLRHDIGELQRPIECIQKHPTIVVQLGTEFLRSLLAAVVDGCIRPFSKWIQHEEYLWTTNVSAGLPMAGWRSANCDILTSLKPTRIDSIEKVCLINSKVFLTIDAQDVNRGPKTRVCVGLLDPND
ncbi:uncharacterized protein PV07_06655 [Cladophialophora immunda]|uniref:Uncharacterized protein n=1 Tax=Cladophialophora immunda TaxID=569365 RepID=A0A0D2C6S0_9EURO|nr:uncharacterized protein PV07_06655 [Cladophialophora immunda]KIW26853.1 hypothetical protein PV07_06655 [Cladophialophora immunda]